MSNLNETPVDLDTKVKVSEDTTGKEDETSIYIDEEQLLNKSDIIKSFVANSDDNRDVSIRPTATTTTTTTATTVPVVTTTTTTTTANKLDETNVKKDEEASDLDEESVSSFGSSIDDYNYYNARLFDDADEEMSSSLEEFADLDRFESSARAPIDSKFDNRYSKYTQNSDI